MDFPFDDVIKAVTDWRKNPNVDFFQKFTCSGCGQRLTIDEPNVLYETGTCDKCPAVTDIRKQGCNFMIHARYK